MKEIFSPSEIKILEILGNKKMFISEIVAIFYKNTPMPMTPKNIIAGGVNRINRKCTYLKLNWYLRGQGLGRGGKMVWKDKQPKG